jgi:hypothetical protein
MTGGDSDLSNFVVPRLGWCWGRGSLAARESRVFEQIDLS